MISFLLARISATLPVALAVLVCVASLARIIPGDPVDTILGDFATAEDRRELSQKLGLDQTIYAQIRTYVAGLVRGDLGDSIIYRRPVAELIAERTRATVELALVSLAVAVLLGVPLGVLAAMRQGSLWDLAAMSFAVAGVAIPNFWLGPVLVLVFSLHLDWTPVSERGDWTSYVLPAITMGTALSAAISRITRNSFLENIKKDFVRTARAKGCTPGVILWVHVMRNAAIPLVTIISLQFGVLLTGAIITEQVFDWPGLGTLLIDALFQRDYPVVQGCILLFSLSYITVNFLTDVVYGIIDPRIKIS